MSTGLEESPMISLILVCVVLLCKISHFRVMLDSLSTAIRLVILYSTNSSVRTPSVRYSLHLM